MRHIVVVAAGGSKCDALLLNDDGRILGFGHRDFRDLPPGNRLGGTGRSAECVDSAVRDALGGLQSEEIHVAYNFPQYEGCRECGLHARRVISCCISERESIFAMLERDDGIVAMAGTGAFVYARNRDGRELFLDALGPTLGDYGSGYYIGRLAIRAAAKSGWHPRHRTSLSRPVCKACAGSEELDDALRLVEYTLATPDRSEIASLVPIVDREACAGDGVARSILKQAAEAFGETLYDVVDRLDMAGSEYYMMCSGGVITHSALYREYLFECVKDFAPRVIPVVSDLSQVAGMALCMLQRLRGPDAGGACKELVRSAAERAPHGKLF